MHREWGELLPVTGWAVVVEHDPTLRMLMVEILTEIGLPSLDFETADDALNYLLSMPEGCPLVITDHDLPGHLKGIGLIKKVKARWPSTATILTSGYGLDASIVPYSTLYLEKPLFMDDLVVAVANLLQPGHPLRKTS